VLALELAWVPESVWEREFGAVWQLVSAWAGARVSPVDSGCSLQNRKQKARERRRSGES